jgi:chorismate mutase
MSEFPSDLEHLRRRIDEIDDRLQDLLIERIDIVSRVAAYKHSSGGVAAHQPSREAEIIRRLIARNRGGLPPATLVRMWRELLAATVRLQGPFAIAVYAPPDAPGYWDLARDHYGSHTPMQAYGSAGQIIRSVTEGQAAIGILPMPREEDLDPWWRYMVSTHDNAPHVIARLPFGGRGNGRPDGGDALAIGRPAPQPTGRDRTLLAAENASDISRGRLFSTLAGLGLSCTFMASCEHAEDVYTLIELDGFVPLSDPRLEQLRGQLGAALYRLLRFGGYAVPLSATELASPHLTTGSGATAASSAAAAKG